MNTIFDIRVEPPPGKERHPGVVNAWRIIVTKDGEVMSNHSFLKRPDVSRAINDPLVISDSIVLPGEVKKEPEQEVCVRITTWQEVSIE